ncbi:transketolase [Ammoniphilus sp. CFH 90114]|uniref:transketolase n=1 Tax=Ammoniphilus sp. CFH 90114 TaxID=2493665 RepID=UPI00100FF88B|nr:transketolase [Ammoniphilus sp. CFH 90114]RXT02389.1 transketolase [Ammoniphilus sp. CFH 90114]
MQVTELVKTAREIRRNIIRTVYRAQAGHLGGPLSATDLLTALYFEVMKIDPDNPKDVMRDRFVLSKGHSAIALYCTLAERGYFSKAELETFDKINSRLQAHPDMTVLPGLDMSTGSLGIGISNAVGIALGSKLEGSSFHTYCMVGDGETQEGQVWEAADTAVKYKLDNLTVVLDYNGLQQYGWPGTEGKEREIPVLEPAERWKAFGFHVISIDGHDMLQILRAFREAKGVKGKPTIIIAHTVKGKGVSFMEGQYLWHSRVPTDPELQAALEELAEGVV